MAYCGRAVHLCLKNRSLDGYCFAWLISGAGVEPGPPQPSLAVALRPEPSSPEYLRTQRAWETGRLVERCRLATISPSLGGTSLTPEAPRVISLPLATVSLNSAGVHPVGLRAGRFFG